MPNSTRIQASDSSPTRKLAGAGLWNSPRVVSRALLGTDLAGVLVSFQLATLARLGRFLEMTEYGLYGIMALLIFGLYLADTYDTSHEVSGLWAPARVVLATAVMGALTAVFVYLFGVWGTGPLYGRGVLVPAMGIFTVWAVATRRAAARWRQSHAQQMRWLILGDENTAEHYRDVVPEAFPHSQMVFLADDEETLESSDLEGEVPYSGSWKKQEVWAKQIWSGVLLGKAQELPDDLIRRLMKLRMRGVPIYSMPEFYEQFFYRVPPDFLEDDWFVFAPGFGLVQTRINFRIKRWLDILASGVMLLLFSPVLLLTAIAIKLESSGPIIYSQVRSGLNREPFKIYKFRSMREDAEAEGEAVWAQERDPRVTRVGRWIRRTRIDELPQLWNVLRGDMTLIGPRPERPEFDEKLAQRIPYYNVRYLVKPGLTGWAQVMYSYGSSVDDAQAKLEHDLYYIKNYSLLLDIAIAFKTVRVVLFGKGR